MPDAAIPIRVLLVDDHTLFRQGLRTTLEAYPNIKIVGEASDGEEALSLAKNSQPSVILMDLNMPRMDGITTTRLIKAQNPEIVIVGLTSGLEEYQMYAMQKAGAFEVLAKDVGITEVYSAIQRGVAAVKPVLILQEPSNPENPPQKPEALTNLTLSDSLENKETTDMRAQISDDRPSDL